VIGFLRGQIAAKQPPTLLLDVNGVGYEIEAPMSTFYTLRAVGEPVSLFTHLVVREDAHILYGFASESERRLFRALLKISGVGPKMALGILSGSSVEDFLRTVEAEDAAMLTRIPGIGRKTAERVIIEMRDSVKKFSAAGGGLPGAPIAGGKASAQSEAFGALVALGYKPVEVTRLLKSFEDSDMTTEELIRSALKAAAKT
jgi:Holliday junction DNA helicase RuvA